MRNRKRQCVLLTALTKSGGSLKDALAMTGIPKGTAWRWQATDEWYRRRYNEIRDLLRADEENLRASLNQASIRLALGRYSGTLRGKTLRNVIDQLDARDEANSPEAKAAKAEEMAQIDAQILELLGNAWPLPKA